MFLSALHQSEQASLENPITEKELPLERRKQEGLESWLQVEEELETGIERSAYIEKLYQLYS
jgi:hypothetical protein